VEGKEKGRGGEKGKGERGSEKGKVGGEGEG